MDEVNVNIGDIKSEDNMLHIYTQDGWGELLSSNEPSITEIINTQQAEIESLKQIVKSLIEKDRPDLLLEHINLFTKEE